MNGLKASSPEADYRIFHAPIAIGSFRSEALFQSLESAKQRRIAATLSSARPPLKAIGFIFSQLFLCIGFHRWNDQSKR